MRGDAGGGVPALPVLCSFPQAPQGPGDSGQEVLTPLKSLGPDPPCSAQPLMLTVPMQPFLGVRWGPVGSGDSAGLCQGSLGEASKLFPCCPLPCAAAGLCVGSLPYRNRWAANASASLPPGQPQIHRAGPLWDLQRDAWALAEVTQSPAKINPGLPMSKMPGHCQTWVGGHPCPLHGGSRCESSPCTPRRRGPGAQRQGLAFNHPKHSTEGEEILEASTNIKRVVLYVRSHLWLINDYCTF